MDGKILPGLAQADGRQYTRHATSHDGEAQSSASSIDRQVTLLSTVFLPMMMTLRGTERIIQTD
jgi:hypothetical protein